MLAEDADWTEWSISTFNVTVTFKKSSAYKTSGFDYDKLRVGMNKAHGVDAKNVS